MGSRRVGHRSDAGGRRLAAERKAVAEVEDHLRSPDQAELGREVIPRVGRTPQERLAWAVRLAERSPRAMTSGDWENLRLEIPVFIGLGLLGGDKDTFAAMRLMTWGREGLLAKDAAEAIRRMFGEAIFRAVRREPIEFGPFTTRLVWAGGAYGVASQDDVTDAVLALERLLHEHGHLVRECQAPAPRGDEGQLCRAWFVANRPRQEFCSPRCQSRATTRAYRDRGARLPRGRSRLRQRR